MTREQANGPQVIRQVEPAFERAVPLGVERVMIEVHPEGGPDRDSSPRLLVCQLQLDDLRAGAVSRLGDGEAAPRRELGAVSGEPHHRLHDGAVVDDEAAVCVAGAERDFDTVCRPLRDVLCNGARGSRAREECERSGIDHARVFLHRFFARAGVVGLQHVTGMAVTRFGTFISALRYGRYNACVTTRERRTSSLFPQSLKSLTRGDGTFW